MTGRVARRSHRCHFMLVFSLSLSVLKLEVFCFEWVGTYSKLYRPPMGRLVKLEEDIGGALFVL